MKQFLYGRLYAKEKGYSFYILPVKKIGSLSKAIANDLLSKDKRWLFLEKYNGQISFGIREQLLLKDEFGRLRTNFMGYQLEEQDNVHILPFLNELREQFRSITQQAEKCHRLLEQNTHRGVTLQEMEFEFRRGTFNPGNDWDNAIRDLDRDVDANMLLIFDEWGAAISNDTTTSKNVGSNASLENVNPSISNSIQLDESEKIRVMITPQIEQKRKGCWLGNLFGGETKNIDRPQKTNNKT